MLRSKENYNLLMSVLDEYMKKHYKYEFRQNDLHLLTKIMDDTTYNIPKEREETMDQYTDKINKIVINEFLKFKAEQFRRLMQSQQQSQPSSQNRRPSPPSSPSATQNTPDELPQRRGEFEPNPRQLPPPVETRPKQIEDNGNLTHEQMVQRDVQTEQDIINKLKQENKILDYENDKLLKNQNLMVEEKNHYIKLYKEAEQKLTTLKSKMASHNIDGSQVAKILIDSDSNNQFHEGTFIYKFNYSNLYKIVLKSGFIECFNNFNILDHNNTFIVKEDDNERKIQIEYGNYDLKELISALEDKLNNKVNTQYILSHDETTNKIYIKSEKEFTIISTLLSNLLGFDGLKTGDIIYSSDYSARLHRNHSCYIRLKVNSQNVGMIELKDKDNVFAITYDEKENNSFAPKEEFYSTLIEPINMEELRIEIVSDKAIYDNQDVFFQFMFDIHYN